jgi:magnesium-transporting ATPase (P-type)
MSYEFVDSTQSSTTIKVLGKEEKFEVLQLFPFTSDRKRMSIIVKDKQDGLIKMYTKGVTFILNSGRQHYQAEISCR